MAIEGRGRVYPRERDPSVWEHEISGAPRKIEKMMVSKLRRPKKPK